MSGRKYSYLFPLIVLVVFFLFSITTNEASSRLEKDVSAKLQTIIEKIKAGPGVDDPVKKREKLAEKIINEYAELKTIFESEDSPGNKMAKILGKKATLVVGSEKYHGKKEIRDFWNLMKAGHQHVDFTLKWAFIVFEEKITEEMEDYDHIAYEHFTFKLLDQPEGKILKNQDGEGGRSCRHIHGCECRTR
jgi:hypothetical protein